MRKATCLAVLAAVATFAMALAGGSSAAGPTQAQWTKQRSGAGHVSSSGWRVVKQVGKRNYAGPNCPGRAWNCTTSTRVLQVATAGGTNVAQCLGGSFATPNDCVISQTGGAAKNTARCTETGGSSPQNCTITQSGGANYAFVDQSFSQTAGSTQFAAQKATVTQTGTVLNQLQLSQAVSQSTKIGTEQKQNAYQSVVGTQTATGAATNFSSVYQSQLQKEYARSTTQSQNADTTGALPDCVTGTDEADGGPSKPNACANIVQSSVDGKNDNHLRQSINEDMNSTGAAFQTQGSSDGGLEGHVHQDTSGTASQTNEVNESKSMKETQPKGATPSSQTQIDPISCCGFFSQEGGTGNTETISQSSALNASNPGANQSSDVIGTSNTDGTCNVSQTASINGDSATNSANFTPCPFLTVETSCSGGSESSVCTAETPVLGEPDSDLSLCVQNLSAEDFSCTASTGGTSGNVLQYEITYTNSGTGAAHDVLVTSPIPAMTGSPVNLNCPVAVSCAVTYDESGFPTGITWSVGTVAPDTTVSATFQVTVISGGCGTRTIHATVDTAEEAPVTSNDATVILPDCIN